MKIRALFALCALAAAGCTTKNENSALVITALVPPTATVTTGTTTTVSCAFNPPFTEFSYLPFNPAENAGNVAAVVQNNMISTAGLNSLLRTDTNVFLPHQAVVSYEVVGGGGPALPQNIIPAGGVEVPSSSTGTVGFTIFNGINLAGVAAGTYIRTTFHIEGKLLDGSTVHTSEREYLFRICTTAGCGTSGSWGTCL